jgi:WD40 repeat protein
MRPAPAARLSRFLVGCHPRRWRDRYGEEMLDVLDQHQASTRTLLNLASSAVSTHLDRAYRGEGLTMAWLRRAALISAAVAVPIALLALWIHAATWKDGHWHIGLGGVTAMAFSPADPHILVTATSGNMDGLDTLWDVTSPARPRRLANFEGGAPTAFAPDGRIVATVAFSGQPALWNVANLSKPARITTLPSGDGTKLWGEAFSPDGHILAAAYTDRVYLWNVTNPSRPRLLRTLAAAVAPPWRAGFNQGDIAFSPDGRLLASTAGHNQLALWNVADPARATRIATVPSDAGFTNALAFSPHGNLVADVSYNGTVTILSLANPANPARAAIMQTVTARQIAASICTGGCGPAYTLNFAPDGQTLTAVADLSPPSQQAPYTNTPQPPQVARNYAFRWNVANPRAVTRYAVLSYPVTISGGSSLPLLDTSGRTVVTGASSGFAVTLRTLP